LYCSLGVGGGFVSPSPAGSNVRSPRREEDPTQAAPLDSISLAIMVLDIVLAHPLISLALVAALYLVAKSVLFPSKPVKRSIPKGKYDDKVRVREEQPNLHSPIGAAFDRNLILVCFG
jgi:hypothetical protein